MESGESPLIGHRLLPNQRRNWRFILLTAGVVLVLVGYLLPLYPNYIISARTLFSNGSSKELEFPVLIHNQYYTQSTLPRDETLEEVKIKVAPARAGGSGYSWILQAASAPQILPVLSFIICLAVPLAAAAASLALVLFAWKSRFGLIEWLLEMTLSLGLLAPFALALSWLHQFDFSGLLLALEPMYLAPSIGFWVALAGTISMLVSAAALHQESERPLLSWWALVFAVGLVAWLLVKTKPQPYLEIWRFISDGIVVTLRIVVVSFVFILIVSLIGGLGRVSKSPVIYGIASLYVELIRGIPLMVQLLFIWFALPQLFDALGYFLMRVSPSLVSFGQTLVDLRLSPFTAAVTGLTICYGAYVSEIFRAGISSIHRGQMEAARSLGMSYMQAMRYVVLPQAIRVILPPVGNEFVALLKDSSLVSVLAVSDLTRRGREYMARTFLSFETWIMVALCYLVLTLFSSRAVEFIESKTRFER